MSVMQCKKCEQDIDTDFVEFNFEQDLCMDCATEIEDEIPSD